MPASLRAADPATSELPVDEDVGALVVVRFELPEGDGMRVALPAGASRVVGAAPGADVHLPEPTVSARHCRLAHDGRRVVVEDLGSRNGVRIAGARVPFARLGLGGAFALGRVHAVVEPPAGDEAATGFAAEPLPGLVGRSTPMRRLASLVRRVAPLRVPVLLRGESGTGKDLVARALHDESPRRGRPFVTLNAATISRELAESELFGHLRGAFTGALRDRRGAFREAHGGTLFLDEIAALPLEVQAKLLRAVEEGVVRPLGGEAAAAVDVRLVVATCEPLERMVAERAFRADLYERLAVCRLLVPALRDRAEDVPALARFLLERSEVAGRPLAPGAVELLRAQRWPGNVRELRNVVVQAALRAGASARIEVGDVVAVLAERAQSGGARITPLEARRLLVATGGNVSAAARRAGVPRSTLRDRLREATPPSPTVPSSTSPSSKVGGS